MRLGMAIALPMLGAPSGGGAAAYNASGVLIYPEGYVQSTQLGNTDTAVGLVSLWFRGTVGTALNPAVTNDGDGWSLGIMDILSNAGPGFTSETVPGLNITTDNSSGIGNFRFNWNDATGGSGHSIQASVPSFLTGYDGGWHHLILSWDFTSVTTPLAVAYWDGVKISNINLQKIGSLAGPDLKPNIMNNTRGLMMGGNSGNTGALRADYAQVLLDTGSSYMTAGDLPASLVKRFYNNGPVDYGTDGSTALGVQPQVYLNGDKSTFLTNKGSSAATFTSATQGANNLGIDNSSYGPAGNQTGRPARLWEAEAHASAVASIVPTNYGMPIASGDLLLLLVVISDATGNINHAIQTPAGWTPLWSNIAFPQQWQGAGNDPMNVAAWYKNAAVGDVTATGADWSGPTVSWTTASGSVSATVINYGQAHVQAGAATAFTTGTTAPTAPTVTPTSAATTLMSGFAFYRTSTSGKTTPPTGQKLAIKSRGGAVGSIPYWMCSDEPLTGTSATGIRTASQGTATECLGLNVVIGP